MRGSFRTLIIVSLTVGLMGFFLRNADLQRVWGEIVGAERGLLAIALVVTLGAYLFRVERWRHLLAPIGHASFTTAFRATVMGFAANAILPGRIGEVLRPFVLARREGLSATAAFATIVIERLLDLLLVCLLFAAFIVLFDPQIASNNRGLLATVNTGAAVAGLGAIAALVIIFVIAGHPERAGRAVERLVRVAPGGLGRAIGSVALRFLEGLAVTRQARPVIVALGWSVPLWLSNAFSTWCVTQAFGIDVPFGGAVILMALVVVGVAVPTPAGVGGYHAAYELGATALYGAAVDRAVGAALVMHLFSFGPVAVLGLVFMAQEGVRVSRLSQLTGADAVAAEDAGQNGPDAEPAPDEEPAPPPILPRHAEDDRSSG